MILKSIQVAVIFLQIHVFVKLHGFSQKKKLFGKKEQKSKSFFIFSSEIPMLIRVKESLERINPLTGIRSAWYNLLRIDGVFLLHYEI